MEEERGVFILGSSVVAGQLGEACDAESASSGCKHPPCLWLLLSSFFSLAHEWEFEAIRKGRAARSIEA
jgi:hypothetical protein